MKNLVAHPPLITKIGGVKLAAAGWQSCTASLIFWTKREMLICPYSDSQFSQLTEPELFRSCHVRVWQKPAEIRANH